MFLFCILLLNEEMYIDDIFLCIIRNLTIVLMEDCSFSPSVRKIQSWLLLSSLGRPVFVRCKVWSGGEAIWRPRRARPGCRVRGPVFRSRGGPVGRRLCCLQCSLLASSYQHHPRSYREFLLSTLANKIRFHQTFYYTLYCRLRLVLQSLTSLSRYEDFPRPATGLSLYLTQRKQRRTEDDNGKLSHTKRQSADTGHHWGVCGLYYY